MLYSVKICIIAVGVFFADSIFVERRRILIQDAMKAVEAAENAASEKIQAARSDADKIRRDSELQYQKIKDDAVISSRKSKEKGSTGG